LDSVCGSSGASPIRRGQEDQAKMSWTDEQVELLRQLWLDGKSASQISAQIGHGLSRNAVIGKVHRLGLAGRAKSPSSSAVAAPRPAPAPRLATRVNAGGAARAAVRGATALALSAETILETRPVFQEEDVVVPMSLRVTIIELREAMCRWPLGDPTSSEFRYCGSPTLGVGPYCAHHSKLAYQPAQDRRRERDRERRALAR
jgi:GcrA cell cycle regulator